MNKLVLILFFIGFYSTAQKVSNITTRQEQSTIIVSYDLETKLPCKVSLYVSTNGGTTWQGPLKKVVGDVGDKIISGKHSINWNVLEEFEELTGKNVKFQVKAEELKTKSIVSINKELLKNPKDAKLYKLRGDLKHEKGDFDGAIKDYSKAILLNPKYADAYIARAGSRPFESTAQISDYSKAIGLNPNDALTFYYRANSKIGLKDYNGAIFDYSKALELEPKNIKFLFARARAKRELKDYNGSVDDCNKVIEFDSISIWDRNSVVLDTSQISLVKRVYWIRGINKYNLNDIEGANSDFEIDFKIQMIPKYIGYIKIGSWRFNNEDYKSAIDYFTKSIDLLPETLVDSIGEREAYVGRAFSKYMQKNEIGATVDFNEYIEKSQNKAEANYRIACGFGTEYLGEHFNFFLDINNFKEEIYYFTKAIELDPKVDNYFYCRAKIKEELKEYRGAIEDYTEAIELNSNEFDYYFDRADVKMRLKDYRGAILDYNKAIELEPKTDYFYYYLGIAKFDLKDYRGAIADFSKAILLAPNSEDYYLIRGNSKYNIGDYKGAIADYNKVILLNPKNGEAYLSRGDSKIEVKDKSGACKDFSKAGELGEEKAYDAINENCN
jgi:tetratricopeptide (TPR) repeat protein